MLRFLHAADIHLDSPLAGLQRYVGAPVDEIRGATRLALENLVELAIQQSVDFVVVAGDVYDGDWKDHNTGLAFVQQMSRLREADIPVVLISGNHDAANKMTKSLPLPDNVEWLSSKRPQTSRLKKLAELGVAVHGRSFAQAVELDNLAREYPDARSGMFNIGLLHTSLAGADGHEPYAPCSLDDLRQKDYGYWALGHVHARAVVCEDPHIVFSGNLQGRHIRETGPKGCYLVTVDDSGNVQMEFHPLDVFRWDNCRLIVDDARTPDDVLALFSDELPRLLRRHADLPLALRVIVSGRSRAHAALAADLQAWTENLRAVATDASSGRAWIEKIQLQTSAVVDLDREALMDGPIGELLRTLQDLRDDEVQLQELSRELGDLRRKLPPELVRGGNALGLDEPSTMLQWIDEVEPILLQRLLEGRPT